jgi:hypothetical protein
VNALIDGARVSGERRFFAKAEQLIHRVVHPLEDITRHRLDDPEERWFYIMFLQSLGKYLHAKVELGELDASYVLRPRQPAALCAMDGGERVSDSGQTRKGHLSDGNLAAQDIRKSDVLHYAAMHADQAERATFSERAEYFHRTSTTTLASKPTRALARPVIVLLTSGFVQAWRHRHPDAVEPQPAATPAWAPVVPFVPQRARAERRLKWIAAAVIGVGTLGLGWLLLHGSLLH